MTDRHYDTTWVDLRDATPTVLRYERDPYTGAPSMRVSYVPNPTTPPRLPPNQSVNGVVLEAGDSVYAMHLVMAWMPDGIAAAQLVVRRPAVFRSFSMLISVVFAEIAQREYVVDGTPTLAEVKRIAGEMADRIADSWDAAGAATVVVHSKDTEGMTLSQVFAAFEQMNREASAEVVK